MQAHTHTYTNAYIAKHVTDKRQNSTFSLCTKAWRGIGKTTTKQQLQIYTHSHTHTRCRNALTRVRVSERAQERALERAS